MIPHNQLQYTPRRWGTEPPLRRTSPTVPGSSMANLSSLSEANASGTFRLRSNDKPPNHVSRTLETFADGAAAIHSSVRRSVLQFLNLKSVHRASRISEAWFEAARDPNVFDNAVEKHFALNRNAAIASSSRNGGVGLSAAAPMLAQWYPQIHTPFRFTHPGVFLHVLHSAVQYHDSLKSLLAEDDAFFKVCASLFGSLSNRFAFQFPVLLFMLHAAAPTGSTNGFLYLKPDLTSRCEYIEKRRFLLLIANVVRWHESYPAPGEVPWLVELYRWASLYAPPPFDQIMIMPALTLVQQHATGAVLLTERTVMELVTCTEALLARFLPVDEFHPAMLAFRSGNAASPSVVDPSTPTKAAASTPRGGAAPPPLASSSGAQNGKTPPFEVEREIFRVVVVLLEQFRATMPLVREALANVMMPYGSLGVEELIQYRARLDVFRTMKHIVLEERRLAEQAEFQRSLQQNEAAPY